MTVRHRKLATLGAALLLISAALVARSLLTGAPAPVAITDQSDDAAPDQAGPQVDLAPGVQVADPAGDRTVASEPAASADRSSLSGRVESLEGDAIEGALVSASGGHSGVTDSAGHFRFEALPRGTYSLDCAREGFAAIPAPPVHLHAAPLGDVVLRMEPALSLHGFVHGEDGLALEGARVSATIITVDRAPRFDVAGVRPAELEALTDASGHFELGPLPAGRVMVRARRAGFTPFGRFYLTSSPELDVTLSRLTGVFGRVVSAEDDRQLRVTRASLLVQTRDGDGPWKVMDDPSGVSDVDSAEGHFALYPRTRRPMRVVVEGPDFVRAVSDVFRLDGKSDHGPLVLRGHEGQRITGVVHDELGTPIASARVEYEEQGGANELVQTGPSFYSAPILTDASGRFRTAPIAQTTGTVLVRAEGYAFARRELSSTGEDLDIVLMRAGSIRGRLQVAGTGALPYCAMELTRLETEGLQLDRRPVVSTGFQFTGLTPGTWALKLRTTSSRSTEAILLAEAVVIVEPGKESYVELEPDQVGALSGVVTIDGRSAPFCEVLVATGTEQSIGRCSTAADGTYAFSGLPAGEYSLAVRTRSDLAAHGQTQVEVRVGEVTLQDLKITTGSLRGVVTDADSDEPLASVRVRVERVLPGQTDPVLLVELDTDKEGVFAHGELPVGSLLITPTRRFFAGPERVALELVSGYNGVPSISMAAAGTLEILLRSSGEVIYDELEVVLRRAHDETVIKRVRRKGAGRVRLGELAPGIYDVEVENQATGDISRSTASVRVQVRETLVIEL